MPPPRPLRFSLEELAAHLRRQVAEPFFVQIGAMDGVRFDPVFPLVRDGGWRGLLVEPLRDHFEALVENYRGIPQMRFANVAVTEHSGTETINRVDPDAIRRGAAPEWAAGISSFFKDRNSIGGAHTSTADYNQLQGHVVQETVRCVTLGELLAEHRVERIDFLQIDTEGYDFRVLRQLDFARHRPALIHLEHYLLPPDEQRECFALLLGHGYVAGTTHKDLLATTLLASASA
jgi:FkbM family methyltransferase